MTRFKRNALALAVGVCLGAASAYSYATGTEVAGHRPGAWQ